MLEHDLIVPSETLPEILCSPDRLSLVWIKEKSVLQIAVGELPDRELKCSRRRAAYSKLGKRRGRKHNMMPPRQG